MTRETDRTTLVRARLGGAVVVDVREPAEYDEGQVPGADNLPLAALPARVAELPDDQRVSVVCARGNRSATATDLLVAAGKDAVSVRGGTHAWVEAGRDVTSGPTP